jgi:Na+/melibiose symporter-like transporter
MVSRPRDDYRGAILTMMTTTTILIMMMMILHYIGKQQQQLRFVCFYIVFKLIINFATTVTNKKLIRERESKREVEERTRNKSKSHLNKRKNPF